MTTFIKELKRPTSYLKILLITGIAIILKGVNYVPDELAWSLMISLGICLFTATYRPDNEWKELSSFSSTPLVPTGPFIIITGAVLIIIYLFGWIFS